MSALLAFYNGEGRDAAGRAIAEIWAWDRHRLELVHDFIQWLFPLPDASRFNPDAPLLTAADIAAFHSNPALQARVLRSLDLMLGFLDLTRDGQRIARGVHFAKTAHWLAPLNHNHLRITRIMLFLRHVGLDAQASSLLACLEDIAAHEGAGSITPRTLAFWRDTSMVKNPKS